MGDSCRAGAVLACAGDVRICCAYTPARTAADVFLWVTAARLHKAVWGVSPHFLHYYLIVL